MGAIVNNQVFRDYKPVSCEPGDIVFFREEFDINIGNDNIKISSYNGRKYVPKPEPTFLYGKVIQPNINNEICNTCKHRKCAFKRDCCKFYYKDVEYVKLDMVDYCRENNVSIDSVAEYFKEKDDNGNNNGNLAILIPQVLSSFDIVFMIKKDNIVKNPDGTDNAEVKKQVISSLVYNIESKNEIRRNSRRKMKEEKDEKFRKEAAIVEDCEPHMLKVTEEDKNGRVRYQCVKCNGLFNNLLGAKIKKLIFCEKCNNFKKVLHMIRSEKPEDMVRGNYGGKDACVIYRICKACGEVDRKEAQRIREENIRREKEERKRKRCKEVIKEFPSLKDVGFLGM